MAPPARLSMVEWAESTIYLSPRESPVPGLIRLSKQQRGILEAIDSGETQFITVLKSARAGLTTVITLVIAYVAAHRASNILLMEPRELDCRNIAIDIIGPMFENSPTLRGLINQTGMGWNSEPQRDTMLQKNFTTGANLKIMAMTSPANLRGLNIRHLFIDETDAVKVFPAEGDPISLATKRTEGFLDRLIIMASTPTGEETGLSPSDTRKATGGSSSSPVPTAAPFSSSSGNISLGRKAGRRRRSRIVRIAVRSSRRGTSARSLSKAAGGQRGLT